ncbi:hypothetical protein STSP2_01881 [Anaerohalosphaera lusitana]|uniref:Uncharacterized protein n=1 Tax=Anaerohalosphaera lusitana TaxID=1936003 RepID=A0A1U9NLB9_9BACT|nr:hypothetical protein [Anaerohalosphaera lusitana]AQT68709.1 hypothetical protein STSP2_01881 [Anaerohalosphaera lusitana]
MPRETSFAAKLCKFVLTLAKLPIWVAAVFTSLLICWLIGLTFYRAAIWIYNHYLSQPW